MIFQALADLVTEEDLSKGRLYPPLSDIQSCSLKIAIYIAEHAYRTGMWDFVKGSISIIMILNATHFLYQNSMKSVTNKLVIMQNEYNYLKLHPESQCISISFIVTILFVKDLLELKKDVLISA